MVAKLHYESDMPQVEIAKKLGVSTATVSRLLTRARALGIVRIEVMDLAIPDEITARLIEVLGLKRAAVVDTPSTGVLSSLATPLGNLLKEENLSKGAVVGIGWGRAVREVIQAGIATHTGRSRGCVERRITAVGAPLSNQRICPPGCRTVRWDRAFSSCSVRVFGRIERRFPNRSSRQAKQPVCGTNLTAQL